MALASCPAGQGQQRGLRKMRQVFSWAFCVLPRGAQPDQLHRRQPPPRLIPGIPGERGQPVHRHQPAAIIAGDQPDPGRDLRRPGGQQRQGQLAEHTSHHPPHFTRAHSLH